jgi:hypothetical protein
MTSIITILVLAFGINQAGARVETSRGKDRELAPYRGMTLVTPANVRVWDSRKEGVK